MPLYNKEKIYSVPIKMKGSSTLTYVYGSKQDMTGLTADLGITAIANAAAIPAMGVFTGANSPKPPVGSKQIGMNNKKKSSFCDPAVASTKTDVNIKYPKNRTRAIHTPADRSLVVSVYVTCDGIKRAWNMPKLQYALISADFTELGIELCTKTDVSDYVWGCEAPFPARAKTYKSSGDEGGDEHITFVADTKVDSLTTWTKITDSISVQKYFGLVV